MSEQEEEFGRKKAHGVSRHGFRSAAEVALAHWEEQHGPPPEKLRVEFYITADNPVRDYIAVLQPPPGA
jgi:hypothetical protein